MSLSNPTVEQFIRTYLEVMGPGVKGNICSAGRNFFRKKPTWKSVHDSLSNTLEHYFFENQQSSECVISDFLYEHDDLIHLAYKRGKKLPYKQFMSNVRSFYYGMKSIEIPLLTLEQKYKKLNKKYPKMFGYLDIALPR